MRRKPLKPFLAVLLLGLIASPLSADNTRLLRFPDIHGEQVAFVYAGDIYLAGSSGGVAQRLTSGNGMELFL